MFAKRSQGPSLSALATLLLTLSLVITGCNAAPAPSATPTPAQIAAAKPPTILLDVKPASEVQTGQGVAIVAKVEPYEKLDLKWSVSGTSGGKLSADTGEQVVYTAGQVGVDIVVAEGKTASGTPVKQTVALTIVAAPPTAAPTQPPTQVPSTTAPSTITTTSPSASTVTLTSLQNNQTVPCENLATGTYTLDIKDHIWPVVLINNRYHVQDEGGKAPTMIDGNWFATVRFGECTKPPEYDKGKLFQLIIVTADSSANAVFEEYLKTAASKNWAGLPALPPGAKEYVRIVVTRQ